MCTCIVLKDDKAFVRELIARTNCKRFFIEGWLVFFLLYCRHTLSNILLLKNFKHKKGRSMI
jgi:hypothetical protein